MKIKLAKSIALSLLAPVFMGIILGLYTALTASQYQGKVFFSVLLSALANAHIAGLAIALFVVPGYLLMYRFNCVKYAGVLTLGLLGGACVSVFFGASQGGVFILNTIMAALASGLFLYGLRRHAPPPV